MTLRSTAAFFRVEGPLLKRPTLAAPAWMASQAQEPRDRFTRMGAIALAVPLALAGPAGDRGMATRLGWSALRGMSEDRVHILGEEYYERFLAGAVLDAGRDLLDQARRAGHKIVLVSDNLGAVVSPLAEALGAHHLVCNHMGFRDSRATGRLVDPVIGGHVSGQWARAFASEHMLELEGSLGYGSQAADATLLSALGHPCVVRPERALRRIARDLNWPVVEA